MICDSRLVHDPHHYRAAVWDASRDFTHQPWLYCEGRTHPGEPMAVGIQQNITDRALSATMTPGDWGVVLDAIDFWIGAMAPRDPRRAERIMANIRRQTGLA